MRELIGQGMLAKLTRSLIVGIKLAVLVFAFTESIGDPVFQAQEMYILDRARALA